MQLFSSSFRFYYQLKNYNYEKGTNTSNNSY